MPASGSARRVTLASLSVMIALCGLMTGGCQEDNQVDYDALSWRSDRRIVRLDNGLVIVAKRIPTAPVTSVHCWVKTGSIYEREFNGAGISHFLEHLVSGGTTSTRTEEESNEILGRIGASTNAATSLDTVRYYINTSSDNTATAIDLLSDWVANAKITDEEFARERDVIQREFQMGQGEPNRIFWKLTQQARYTAHPARHPTIGYLNEFLKITPEQVRKFYHEMYVPNNMVFVVAGDIDPDTVIHQVTGLWEKKARGRIPGVVFPNERPILAPRYAKGTADIDRPRVRLAWPATKLGDEYDYALDLLSGVLGQGELSRLNQSVRDSKQLVTSIDAYNSSFSWAQGFFGVDAVVEKDKVDQAKQAILEEVYRIKVIGVSDAELERARRKTIAQVVYATQTAHAAAERIASDFIHTGDPDYLDRYAEAIQHVTKADVQMAAAKFLRPDRLITIDLEPGSIADVARDESLVGDRYIASRRNDVDLIDLDNRNLVKHFQSLTPLPDSSIALAITPTRMITLPNGLRVLVQRNTQLPIVSMQWYHLGGQLADTPGQQGVANAMSEMMIKGAGDRSADDIARTLEDLGAEMSTNCGNSTFYVAAQSLSQDWEQVLSIMADVVQRPTFPSKEWSELQPRLLASIDSINDTWYGQLRSEFRKAYFGPNHPWSEPTVGVRNTVASLTAEQLKQFHDDHIAAKDGVIAIFGDVDPDTVANRVRELFADMPAEPKVAFNVPTTPPASGKLTQVETRKTLAAVQIGYGPGMARNNPDYASMLVMTGVLDSFPVGWLDRALRGEGPGLVYAVGAGMMTGAAPGYWAMLFNTKPETVKPAIERSLDVVNRIRAEQVGPEDLERARTKVLVGESMSRQSNGQRAAAAALDELYGLGHDNQNKLVAEIRGVTAGDVQRVAQKYLSDPVGVVLTNKPLPVAELPSITPGDYVPVTPPVATADGTTPNPADGTQPANPNEPSAQPGGNAPATQPGGDTASLQPGGNTPGTQPGGDTPATQPAVASELLAPKPSPVVIKPAEASRTSPGFVASTPPAPAPSQPKAGPTVTVPPATAQPQPAQPSVTTPKPEPQPVNPAVTTPKPEPQPVTPGTNQPKPQPVQPSVVTPKPEPQPVKPGVKPTEPTTRVEDRFRRGNNPLSAGDARSKGGSSKGGSSILRRTPVVPKPSVPKRDDKETPRKEDPADIRRDKDGNPISGKDNPLGATDPRKPIKKD